MGRGQDVSLPGQDKFQNLDGLVAVRGPELLILFSVGGDVPKPLEGGIRHEIQSSLFKEAQDAEIKTLLGAEPTLQAAFQDLVGRLRKSGRRFVVFIDDIDRLEPAEIRAIMQMVKSVGQLPNVVYVLVYDRRIVWRALGESEQRKGGEPHFHWEDRPA